MRPKTRKTAAARRGIQNQNLVWWFKPKKGSVDKYHYVKDVIWYRYATKVPEPAESIIMPSDVVLPGLFSFAGRYADVFKHKCFSGYEWSSNNLITE